LPRAPAGRLLVWEGWHEESRFGLAILSQVRRSPGGRFWKLAGRLTHDMAGAKAWLARNSAELWRYG